MFVPFAQKLQTIVLRGNHMSVRYRPSCFAQVLHACPALTSYDGEAVTQAVRTELEDYLERMQLEDAMRPASADPPLGLGAQQTAAPVAQLKVCGIPVTLCHSLCGVSSGVASFAGRTMQI